MYSQSGSSNNPFHTKCDITSNRSCSSNKTHFLLEYSYTFPSLILASGVENLRPELQYHVLQCDKTQKKFCNFCFVLILKFISALRLYDAVDQNSSRNEPLITYLRENMNDIYHCCVHSEKFLMMDRGTVGNMQSFIPKINLRNQCILLSCQQTCMTYTIAVCTVKNS